MAQRGSIWRLADALVPLDAIVWRAEPDTLRIRDVSGAVEELLGYRVSTWLEEPDFIVQRLVLAERERVLATWRAAADHVTELEHGFIDASGRIQRFRNRARVTTTGDSVELVVLMEAVSNDADRVTGELAKAALEDAEVLLVGTDAAGRIQVFSGSCEELAGRSQADVRGQPIWELIAEERERGALRDGFIDGTGEIPRRFVAHWTDAAGERRVVVWSTRAMASLDDGAIRFVFTGVDVSERERVEAALRDSGAAKEFLHQVPAIVWTVDRSLRFTSGDGAALAALGLRPGQLEGVSLHTYFHTDRADDPNIAPTLRSLEGETVTYDADWLGRVFQVVSKPLRNEDGEIIGSLGLALDVTDRVEAERERDRLLVAEREARNEAERALEVRDEFLSIASHELSTPMTSLRLAIETLASGEITGPVADRLLGSAVRQTRQMTRLIGELLDVSRITAGEMILAPEEMNLADAVRETTESLEPLAKHAGCDLTVCAPSPVWGCWDRTRIDQVVSNLVENAIKHAPEMPITVRVESVDDTAMLEVSDRGPGIPPERIPHIFERFERARSALHHGGLGLGLYIVRQLVEAHAGQVTVESSTGAGTTFRVCLPKRGLQSET